MLVANADFEGFGDRGHILYICTVLLVRQGPGRGRAIHPHPNDREATNAPLWALWMGYSAGFDNCPEVTHQRDLSG
jgi:hypothetical protein